MLHKDISDLTETTAVTFMGMSITCCRCHNHPWRNGRRINTGVWRICFRKIAIKNGDRGGEFSIQSASDGDVLHPRRGIAMPPTPLDGIPGEPSPVRGRVPEPRIAANISPTG